MPANFTVYTPTALTGSYFGLALTIAGAGYTGAGDVAVQWQRQVTPVRLPTDAVNAVQLIVGRLDGQVNIRDYYVVGNIPPATELDGGEDLDTPVTVTITAGGASVAFTGLATGKGFVFDKVADRCWALKSGKVVKLLG